jgi:hypothetical protein
MVGVPPSSRIMAAADQRGVEEKITKYWVR